MLRLTDMSVAVVSNAFEAILECRLSEVHLEAERQLHQAQISEQLLPMDRRQPLDRFEFNNQQVIDEQIDSKGVVNDNALIIHRHWHLPPHLQPGMVQSSR